MPKKTIAELYDIAIHNMAKNPELMKKVDLCVCVKKEDDLGVFKDNLEAECINCKARLIHRPFIPKELPKVCMACAKILLGEPSGHA